VTYRGRKLAGVLAELRGAGRSPELVVGTGFNVHHAPGDFPETLRAEATSLRIVSDGHERGREFLAAEYLRELGTVVDELRAGNWSTVAAWWRSMAPAASGRRVGVTGPGGSRFEGTTVGIDDDGALLVLRDDGATVSVRTVDRVRASGS
jgi:BirA family biotin operon repressor/biotin-[acetyl-CoA-carboxylase] ligase